MLTIPVREADKEFFYEVPEDISAVEQQNNARIQHFLNTRSINTEPLIDPKEKYPQPGEPGAEFTETEIPSMSITAFKAQQQGIDTATAAPVGHLEATYGFDKRAKRTAYMKALREHYKTFVPVVEHAESGELLWMNPETKRWSYVDAEGIGREDFQSLISKESPFVGGDVAVIGSEIVGSIAGLFAGGGPQGAIAMGAGGAFFGEAVRLWHGKNIGINDHVTDEQIMKHAAGTAGLSVLGGELGVLVPRLYRQLKAVYSGFNRIGPAALETVDDALTQSIRDDIARVNALAGEELPIAPGEATGIKELLDELETTAQLRATPELAQLSKQELARRRANAGGTASAFEGARRAFGSGASALERTTVGRSIQKTVAPEIGELRKGLETKRAGLEDEVFDIGPEPAATGELTTLGEKTAGTLIREQEKFLDSAASRYSSLAREIKERTGKEPFSKNIEVSALVKDRRREVGKVVDDLQILTAPERRILPKDVKPDEENVLQIFGPRGEVLSTIDMSKDTIKKALTDPEATFTVEELSTTISYLKRRIRDAGTGTVTDSPDVGLMKQYVGAFEKMRMRAFEDSGIPDLYDQALDLNTWYAKQMTKYEESVVGDIIKASRRGVKSLKDSEVFHRVFTSHNMEDSQALVSALKEAGDYDTLDKWQRAILGHYKEKVIGEGDKTAKAMNVAHKKWMREYGDFAPVFFESIDGKGVEATKKLFESRGNLLDSYNQLMQHRDRTLAILDRTIPGRIDSLDPTQVFQRLWSAGERKDPVTIMTVRNKLERNAPTVLADFQELVLRDMRRNFFGSGEAPKLRIEAMSKYLEGNRQSIAALFDKQFVKDLDSIRNVMTMVSRRGESINPSGTASAMFNLARAVVFGPLSHKGYVLRKAISVKNVHAHRAVWMALSSMDNFQQLKKLNSLPAGSREASAIIGMLLATSDRETSEPAKEGILGILGP